jgi:hypothetical protein
VQAKLAERSVRRTFPRAGGRYLLPSGILHCGHCGGRMYGATCRPKRADGSRAEYRGYRCGTNATKPGTCGSYTVPEDTILDKLAERLRNVYLSEERLAGLERQLLKRAEARHGGAAQRAEHLKKRLDALGIEVRQAAQNILRCKDNVDILNEQLTTIRKKREKVARDLAEAEAAQAIPQAEASARVREAFDRLRDLREQLKNAPLDKDAAVVRLLVSRVDVYFEPVVNGKRRWFRFAKGVMKFRPVLDVSGNDEHLSSTSAHSE